MKKKEGGFGVVYQDVMRCPKLTPEAKAIYAYLSSIAGDSDECYPSRELMSKELSMSMNRLDKHLAILVSFGVVEKTRLCMGNLKSRNIYKITHETQVKEELKDIFRGIENKGIENRDLENRDLENEDVRRHIVGGANRTLISAITSLRSCGIGTCCRLSSG